jgi:hypothetical protein
LDLFVAECLYLVGIGADAYRTVLFDNTHSSGTVYTV